MDKALGRLRGDCGEIAHLCGGGEVPRRRRDGEEARVLVDERGRDDASLEDWVGEHVEQEGDVGLHPTDARLLQGERRATRTVSEGHGR